MNKLAYLSQINLLTELSAADLAAIDALVPSASYPPHTVIYEPGNRLEHLYFLKRGRVQLYQLTPDGRQFTLTILGDGNIFGEIDTFATGAGSCYAETMSPTLVCSMTRADLIRFMLRRPRVALKLVEILSRHIRSLHELTATLALEDVRSRVLHLLLKLAQQFGQPSEDGWTHLDLRLTHQDVAHLVGATRETVSTALAGLSRQQAVRTRHGTIEVNPGRVTALVASEAQPNLTDRPRRGGETA